MSSRSPLFVPIAACLVLSTVARAEPVTAPIVVKVTRVQATPPVVPVPQLLVLPLADNAQLGLEGVESFSQALAAELAKADRWRVLTQQDLRTIVAAEQLKQLLGCGETCATDLSSTVGAELVVAGQLGLVGEARVLTVSIVEAKTGVAKARVSRTVPDSQALLAVARVADELVARTFAEPLAELSVTTDPAGALVLVDGHAFGTTPVPPTALRPGPHRLVLQKEAFKAVDMTLELAPDTSRQEVVPLVPVEEQMKVADVAKVAESSALAGAEAASKATQETVTKVLADASTRDEARRAVERAEAAKREEELRRATDEARRVAAASEAKTVESAKKTEDIALRTDDAAASAARAEEEARKAREEAARAAREAEARAEEVRKEAESEAARQAAVAREEISASEKRLERALGVERKRTAGFGLHAQLAFLPGDVASAAVGQGGAPEPLMLIGLDGKIPLGWRLFVGLRVDVVPHAPSGTGTPSGTVVEQRTVPGSLLDGSVGLGINLPVTGPLFVELAVGAGGRVTSLLQRTTLEDGSTGDETAYAFAPVGVAQAAIGLGFGAFQVAATGTASQPLTGETAAPHVGTAPSVAGFGRVVAAGVQLGLSW